MIFLSVKRKSRQEFENLLQLTKEYVLNDLKSSANPATIKGDDFENIVYKAAIAVSKGTEFEGKLEHTSDAAFPDIVAAGYFGIEVKATKKDGWTSIGNSVLESSRIDGVEKIYIFFGKLGGKPDVVYRTYEECLKAIAVTHYPRYVIDMTLPNGQSIFDKMSVSYDEMRSSNNPISHVRGYYKSRLKEGQSLWWIDDNTDNTPSLSPIIKSFSSIRPDKRDQIKAEIFIRFPEILSNSTTKFENIAAYLASERGIVSSNLRDNFTAGGQVEFHLEGATVHAPQVINQLVGLAPILRQKLESETAITLANYWKRHIEGYVNPITSWKKEIDRQASYMELPVPASELYEAAIAGKITKK